MAITGHGRPLPSIPAGALGTPRHPSAKPGALRARVPPAPRTCTPRNEALRGKLLGCRCPKLTQDGALGTGKSLQELRF